MTDRDYLLVATCSLAALVFATLILDVAEDIRRELSYANRYDANDLAALFVSSASATSPASPTNQEPPCPE